MSPPDSVEYDEEKPEIEEPIVGNDSEILDNCRGDEQVRCGQTSTYICDVQKCDGVSNCPNGEDEENCPSDSNGDDDASGDGEIKIDESSSIEPEVAIPGDFLLIL